MSHSTSIDNNIADQGKNQEPPFSKECPSLLTQHFQQLHDGSGLSVDVIKERSYESVLGKKRLADLGFSRAQQRTPGILIPLHGVDGAVVSYQYRPDHPRVDRRGRIIRYETPKLMFSSIPFKPVSRSVAQPVFSFNPRVQN